MFVKKGVVVPLGASGDFDSGYTLNPTIIKHAGRFFLYYEGTKSGSRLIGLATSKDGITFVKKGVVLPLGTASDFDSAETLNPTITKHAGRFFLYYDGYDGSKHRIGLATSKDGITFVKKGVVLPLGTAGDFDSGHTHSPTITKHAGRFFLYYDGYDGSKHRIGLATSKDGITFVKKGVVLPLGTAGDFDSAGTLYVFVIKHIGRFFLYYGGFGAGSVRIGLATSKDGITFVKKGVVLPLGASGDFDDAYVYGSPIFKDAGRFFLYYGATDENNYRIGLAISKDGL